MWCSNLSLMLLLFKNVFIVCLSAQCDWDERPHCQSTVQTNTVKLLQDVNDKHTEHSGTMDILRKLIFPKVDLIDFQCNLMYATWYDMQYARPGRASFLVSNFLSWSFRVFREVNIHLLSDKSQVFDLLNMFIWYGVILCTTTHTVTDTKAAIDILDFCFLSVPSMPVSTNEFWEPGAWLCWKPRNQSEWLV